MGNPPSAQTLLDYWNITLFLDDVSHPKYKLTSVWVQTEATGAVACLDSVRHSAVFSFVVISSHHVQNHKPVDKDTNMKEHNKHDNRFEFLTPMFFGWMISSKQ